MKRECILTASGSLAEIKLTEVSDKDKTTGERLLDDFASSRAGVPAAPIGAALLHAFDHCVMSIASLETLSKYCHTAGTWTPCIDPASAISKWWTGGMVIERLVDESDQPVEEHQAICLQIINFVRAHGQSSDMSPGDPVFSQAPAVGN